MGMPSPRHGHAPGNETLITTLYQLHGAAVLAYAHTLTRDRAAAEDVLQETLLRAWRHAGELSETVGSIRSWLFTVARNVVVDNARAKAARPREIAETPVTVPTQRDHAQQVVDSMTALQALEQLSEDHRIVLIHIYFEGRTVNETAQVLGIPPGTVKSRSHYALKTMRDFLTQSPANPQGVTR